MGEKWNLLTHTYTHTLHECLHRWLVELSSKSLFSSSDAPLCCLPFPACLLLSLPLNLWWWIRFLSPSSVSVHLWADPHFLCGVYSSSSAHVANDSSSLLTSVCAPVWTNRSQWESGLTGTGTKLTWSSLIYDLFKCTSRLCNKIAFH